MTTLSVLILAGIYGAIFGSFLNVVAVRDKKRKTIMAGRSACPYCKHVLTWYELIPVVSFLIQGARCRSCKKPISWRYPLVELGTALLTAGTVWYGYYQQGSVFLTACLLVSGYLLLVVSLIDAVSMEIPVEYAVIAGVIGATGQYVSKGLSWQYIGLGLVVGGGIIAAISYAWRLLYKQDGMGEGDIWLAAALGAVVGYPSVVLVIGIASILGAVVGIIALSKKELKMESRLPFGPFLCLAAVLALYWGQSILRWYIL